MLESERGSKVVGGSSRCGSWKGVKIFVTIADGRWI